MPITLTERLAAAADFVRENRLTADVGTDHGYLPAFLVLSGKTHNVTASDIGTGPLENAKKTVKKYSLEDNISLILSDGLDNIPHNTEDIVIAGMGGTLMTDILKKAEWIRNDNIHLVLQPMTHSHDVRRFLCDTGFFIDKEKACFDDGRVYIVISAYYNGKFANKSNFYFYFGDMCGRDDDASKAYVKKQMNYLTSRYEGLKKTGQTEEAQMYFDILREAKRHLPNTD